MSKVILMEWKPEGQTLYGIVVRTEKGTQSLDLADSPIRIFKNQRIFISVKRNYRRSK